MAPGSKQRSIDLVMMAVTESGHGGLLRAPGGMEVLGSFSFLAVAYMLVVKKLSPVTGCRCVINVSGQTPVRLQGPSYVVGRPQSTLASSDAAGEA